ncbi:FAD-linked sulfhydryl oxidase ALR [Anopheles arabiensis]|uniref:Sulfhydryl oxidase n=3 Tax=gambiae species complex TaxID=44542 RepID=A0A8W7PZT7_ANOCL|nr:FAD-linked sulfhydryl oxidase ALR [Anopheles arabiensis]XP_040225266.2 FAD-linked sulfhydryl oxidase ALR [Anopheles coluzzii]XP_557147.4 FAD-linked sulfhydryl oxidase ALR [Anopheles gambiae]
MPAAEQPLPNNHHQNGKEPAAPCRTCMDFKSWSKQQRKSLSTSAGTASVAKAGSEGEVAAHRKADSSDDRSGGSPPNCPIDKEQLGRYTWGLLHTIAAYYPTTPTDAEERNVRTFFTSLSKLYPCEYCAKDFQQELKEMPPETKSQHALSQWLCRIHNRVNVKLGKPEFDCTKVNERWRDGWLDGSCD